MSFDSGINMQVCSYLAMNGMQFPLPKNKKKLKNVVLSQKRHAKAGNWKRGIGCTWNRVRVDTNVFDKQKSKP